VCARVNALITTTIRLRFDGRSTAYQRSSRSQWRNTGRWPAIQSRWLVYLFRSQCSSSSPVVT